MNRMKGLIAALGLLLLVAAACTRAATNDTGSQSPPTPTSESRSGGIQGTVVDAQGRPVARMRVGIVNGTAAFPEIAPETDEQGYYQIGGIASGAFEVALHDEDGQRVGLESVDVKSGETTTLDFSLSAKQEALPPMPVMRLRHASRVYDGVEGSYCWPHSRTDDGSVVGLCADKILWDGLSNAIPVEVGSSVTLEVEAEEQAQALSASFYELDSDTQVRFLELGSEPEVALVIDLPEGVYNLAVFGRWPDGDLHYEFRIEVRPELSTAPPEPSIIFPRQEPVVGERETMTALLFGELVEVQGCLRVNDSDGVTSHLLIWPPEFTLITESDAIDVLNGDGEVVAIVGEEMRMDGGEVHSVGFLGERARQEVQGRCPGPYWIVGSEVGLATEEAPVPAGAQAGEEASPDPLLAGALAAS